MKQNRLRLFSSHRRCPMKWVVAAVAALLCSAHAEAQTRIYFEDFEGADDLPAVASPTNGGTSFYHQAGSASSGNTMYSQGWRSYYGHTQEPTNTNRRTAPHLVTGNSTGVFRYAGARSLSIACRAGNPNPHSTNPAPSIVLLPVLSEPVNKLVIKFWFATNTSNASEMKLYVGYVEGTDYTYNSIGSDVINEFQSLQEIPISSDYYSSSTGSVPAKGKFVEVELKNAPSTATRIAIKCDVPASSLKYCCIDDVEVSIAETCKKVSNLAASSITNTSATLTWTEAGESTQWQVRLNGGGEQTVSSTTYALTGLTANTA